MKIKVISFLVLFSISFTQAFAACEEEREARDRAQSVSKTWNDISASTAAVGMIIGGILFGPPGGVCGGVGLLPGIGAFIAKKKLDEKEADLQRCEENYANYLIEKEEKSRQKFIEQQAKAGGKIIGRIFRRTMEDCRQKLEKEIDDLMEEYIASDKDLDDPAVKEEMKEAVEALQKKYF